MQETIQIHDAVFEKFISAQDINAKIKKLAHQINADFKSKNPLLISILNGAFILTADLMKEINIPCEVSFIRVSSYEDMQSTGDVKTVLGLEQNIEGRHVIIIEDIIDSGQTLDAILQNLKSEQPKSLATMSLFFKPESAPASARPDYLGFEIGNRFIIGYGLDYNGQGRQLQDVYQLAEEEKT